MLRVLIFLALLAAVVYAVFWLLDRRARVKRGGGPGKGGSRPVPRGPKGPDDDQDFLRELERKRRHQQRPAPPAPPGTTPPGTTPPETPQAEEPPAAPEGDEPREKRDDGAPGTTS